MSRARAVAIWSNVSRRIFQAIVVVVPAGPARRYQWNRQINKYTPLHRGHVLRLFLRRRRKFNDAFLEFALLWYCSLF
jgi:hypothetical protein